MCDKLIKDHGPQRPQESLHIGFFRGFACLNNFLLTLPAKFS